VSGRAVVAAAALLMLPLVTPRIRGADEIEYFSYLPSALFDGDLEFGDEYERFHAADPEGLRGFRETFLERREPATGRHINFAPLGTALLWSPFFLLAHGGVLLARALGAGVAADGFSAPYLWAVALGSWAYASAGLLLGHDLLRRLGVEDKVGAAAVVAAAWGTPALYYVTLAPGFSHAVSLFAVAALVWATLRTPPEEVTARRAALLGLLGGLAALVREQDALVLLVPLGWLAAGALRTRRVGAALLAMGVVVATAAATFVPQLLAYKAVNGAYGPSRLVTRKMAWTSPHFLDVLLAPAHGLFAWSPVLLVAAAGLVVAVARRRDAASLLLLAAFLLQAWINGAVESWSQAGAFGSRRFVGLTVVFAWGLATLFALARPRLGPRGMTVAVALAVWWNVSLMAQFGLRLMDRQGLEWPRVAVNQVTEVPRRIGRAAWLFFTDRERLVKEGA
jgi:hypothetical protein